MSNKTLDRGVGALLKLAPHSAWVGLVGSVILGLGRLRWMAGSAGLVDASWAKAVRRGLTMNAASGMTLLGVALLALAWILLRAETHRAKPRYLITFLFWFAPLVFQLGILSSDSRYYADIGWTINHGLDPYTTGLGTTGSPFRVGATWNGTYAVYPALALRLMSWIVTITGSHWFWSVLMMRVLALAGFAMLAWSLPKLAKIAGVDPQFAIWLALFNPITFLHGIGGMHIDMLMVGVIAVALTLVTRPGGFYWAAVVVGIAASIKQPALLAAVPVALLTQPRATSWPKTILRVITAVAIASATLVAVSFATGLGMGWISSMTDTYRIQTLGVATLTYKIAVSGLNVFGLADPKWLLATLKYIQLFVGGVLLVVLFVRSRDQPWRFLVGGSLIWVLTNGGFREWYLLPWIGFLPLARPGVWMRRAASLLIPLATVYSVFKAYMIWDIVPSFIAAAGVTTFAHLRGWLVPPVPVLEVADAEPKPPEVGTAQA